MIVQLLRRLHVFLYAYVLRWVRVRYTLKILDASHREELSKTPVYEWPLAIARHRHEVAAVKQGRFDIAAAPNGKPERKSWQWPFLPASINRLSVPIMKATPYNLRRMSRTPVPRRAINLIKGALISQPWDVRPVAETELPDSEDEQASRIKITKKVFSHPNLSDSFQTFLEQGLEDFCTLGAFVAELGLTPDPERPLKMWPMNVESVRVFASWAEHLPDMPHYAQMTGLKGERGAVLFYDDEVLYVKDNPSTDNPFGLGKMEVAFQSVNDFLGVQGMAGRAGTDQIHKTFMWWESPQSEAHIQIVRRHIQNELEGQAKLSLITGMKKPETVEVTPVTEQDLLLGWQELLIRMIGNAFDMSAMALGIERDINRNTGEVLDDKDFRSAVVPCAKRLQEALTRKVIHGKLGWYDLEFVFLNLDDPDSQTKMDIYARMYASNAITPNQIRKGMNMEKLNSPFADLTQFECMLVNAEVMAYLQDQAQKKSLDRQMALMPPSMGPEGEGAPPEGGAGEGGGPEQGNTQEPAPLDTKGGNPQQGPGQGQGKGVTAPKPVNKLPKFPMAGSRYTAKDIVQMPINQVTDVWKATGLSASQFLRAMDEQEPGILTVFTDEVKLFFKDQLKEEQSKPKKPISPKLLKKWEKELTTRLKESQKRTSDMSEWIWQKGQKEGKPNVGSSPQSKAGIPGKINPVQKG